MLEFPLTLTYLDANTWFDASAQFNTFGAASLLLNAEPLEGSVFSNFLKAVPKECSKPRLTNY